MPVNRAADRTIRGYWAQLVRTALEWSRLPPNAVVVVEVDEDFDKQFRSGTAVISAAPSQYKAAVANIGWNRDVQRSLLGFAIAFTRHHFNGTPCTPTYITTASMAESPVLRTWRETHRTPAAEASLVAEVQKALRGHPLLLGDSDFGRAASQAIEYLAAGTGRWEEFIRSTKWCFNDVSFHENLETLGQLLSSLPEGVGLPGPALALRVVVAVTHTACERDSMARVLTYEGLRELLKTERATIAGWATGPEAAAFFEQLDFDNLMLSSAQLIGVELQHGTIDRRGGPRIPRIGPDAALRARSENKLRIVIGERGTGKTSLVAKWAAERSSAGQPVVWLRCRSGAQSVQDFFGEHGVRQGAVFLATIARREAVLVLDALDQGRDLLALETLCEVAERAVACGASVVAVVRQRHAASNDRIRRLLERSSRIQVETMSDDEIRAIVAMGTPPGLQGLPDDASSELRRLIAVPLHLHFLWELAREDSSLDLVKIRTLAQLMALYWQRVVSPEDAGTNADNALGQITRGMLEQRRLTAQMCEPVGPAIRQLVRAEVVQHPMVAGFGVDNSRVSFVLDSVFDFAVFWLIWRSMGDVEIVESLVACDAFAVGLARSLWYLLEFRTERDGPAATVALGGLAYSHRGVPASIRGMVAFQMSCWVSEGGGQDRFRALVQTRAPGVRELRAQVARTRVGQSGDAK